MDTIVAKLTSGRFLAIVMFTATLCYMAVVEVSIRDAFFALAGGLLRDYFMMRRDDKPKQEEVKNGN